MSYAGSREELLAKKRAHEKRRRENWTPDQRAKWNVSCKKWRDKNKDKVRAAIKRWAKNNPEKVRETNRKWERANPDKVRAKSLRRRFDLTVEDWDKIFDFQSGVCAVCKRPPSEFKKRFAVDHDHSTRIIRGLLCWGCNSLLPCRKNMVEILHRLIEYLENPPAVAALGKEHHAHPMRRKKRKKKTNA